MNNEKYLEKFYTYLKKGEKPVRDHSIGVEFEHFVIHQRTGHSLSFSGLEKIFRKLVDSGIYRPCYERGRLVSLYRDTDTLTIEPGAQLEISIRPEKNISAIYRTYETFLSEVTPLIEDAGYRMLSIGYHPVQRNEKLRLVPKKRYAHMYKYFRETGLMGKDMMKSTNTIHTNIDYIDESDFKRKFILVQKLAPLTNLFFSNTPFAFNSEAPSQWMRILSWLNTDPDRCGFIAEAFDKGFGYESYARKVYHTPMIVSLHKGAYTYEGHRTYAEFVQRRPWTRENMENQFSMLFPVIRAKQRHIEIRMSDGLKKECKIYPILFWKGALYNRKTLAALLEYTESWTLRDVETLYFKVMHQGYGLRRFKNKQFKTILQDILSLCVDGLEGKTEKKKLAGFAEFVLNGQKTFSAREVQRWRKTKKSILKYLLEDYEANYL